MQKNMQKYAKICTQKSKNMQKYAKYAKNCKNMQKYARYGDSVTKPVHSKKILKNQIFWLLSEVLKNAELDQTVIPT